MKNLLSMLSTLVSLAEDASQINDQTIRNDFLMGLSDAARPITSQLIIELRHGVPGIEELNENEKELARNGQKIPAIKAYRERLRPFQYVCLKDAKDKIEAWMAENGIVPPSY
jgi:hypothetical protein